MSGAMLQLAGQGAQDVFLSKDPEVSFFKAVYRRHTNFAMESILQTENGNATFGNRVAFTISRNGDLINDMVLEVTVPAGTAAQWNTHSVGHSIIKHVTLEVGGQKIDEHSGTWLEIWSELTTPEGKVAGFNKMVGKKSDSVFVGSVPDDAAAANAAGTKLYIPLHFFFNRNPGLALPLIALQYHEVKVSVTFNDRPSGLLGDLQHVKLYTNYIFLDTDERRMFAQNKHTMLIQQVQDNGCESLTTTVASSCGSNNRSRLNFNHPTSALFMVTTADNGEMLDFTDGINEMVLQLNGSDRFSKRDGAYFRYVQQYHHLSRISTKQIYMYSFALNPTEHQPSGTLNFSRIDNAMLNLTATSVGENLHVFGMNYNVLNIQSGMAGLAFAN